MQGCLRGDLQAAHRGLLQKLNCKIEDMILLSVIVLKVKFLRGTNIEPIRT
jgi:hypothetical protein